MKNNNQGSSTEHFLIGLFIAFMVAVVAIPTVSYFQKVNDPNYRPDLLESMVILYHPYDSYNETDRYLSTSDGDFNLAGYISESELTSLEHGFIYCFTLTDDNSTVIGFFKGNCPDYDPITTTKP